MENNGLLPECVFIVGFDIECCVLMTAADLFENGIRPIVLTKYCGASGGEEAEPDCYIGCQGSLRRCGFCRGCGSDQL